MYVLRMKLKSLLVIKTSMDINLPECDSNKHMCMKLVA